MFRQPTYSQIRMLAAVRDELVNYKIKNMSKSVMQKVWINTGLNPDNYSASTADAMKAFAVLFANFIGDRPLPEYSASTNKWRWWDNNLRDYKYATTEDLLSQFVMNDGVVV